MKHTLTLVIATCFFTIIYSCNKQKIIENNGLIGKWELSEYYDGYANGGNFAWATVLKENSHTLEFGVNGQYIRLENSGGAFQQCNGNFQLLPDDKLKINSSCQTTIESMKFSLLTTRSMIMDRSGIEGIIRYKYSAIK